jgi:hypothetical protein
MSIEYYYWLLQSYQKMRHPMSDKVHVTDLLLAAKLLADAQQNVMLSYLICMAILEAKQAPKEGTKKAA